MHYICAKAACVITVTIKIGKQKYTVKSKSLPESMSSTPITQAISIPSKLTKKFKAAKKNKPEVKVTAAIA